MPKLDTGAAFAGGSCRLSHRYLPEPGRASHAARARYLAIVGECDIHMFVTYTACNCG